MAEFLTTSGTIHRTEQIITDAKTSLVLISPYVQISRNVYERLQDASKRKVSITFVYGKCELDSEEYETLKQINGLQLFYFDSLHAKCYFNEETLIITSMNLYEYSSKNREMGILLSKSGDKDLYEKAAQEAESIIKNAEFKYNAFRGNNSYNVNTQHASQIRQPLYNPAMGSCIRCATEIQLDSTRPFCRKCFDIWSRFGDPFYEENYCHACGKKQITSMDKPFCYTCYKNHV